MSLVKKALLILGTLCLGYLGVYFVIALIIFMTGDIGALSMLIKCILFSAPVFAIWYYTGVLGDAIAWAKENGLKKTILFFLYGIAAAIAFGVAMSIR